MKKVLQWISDALEDIGILKTQVNLIMFLLICSYISKNVPYVKQKYKYYKYKLLAPKSKVLPSTLTKLPYMHGYITNRTFRSSENYAAFKLSTNLNAKFDGGRIVNLFVHSGGGLVSLGHDLRNLILQTRRNGRIVNCYISKAASMAFYVMQFCNNRYGLKGGILMTHLIHGSSPIVNFMASYDDARVEAGYLGAYPNNWFKASRLHGDKYWTMEEALKKGMIDEIVE